MINAHDKKAETTTENSIETYVNNHPCNVCDVHFDNETEMLQHRCE